MWPTDGVSRLSKSFNFGHEPAENLLTFEEKKIEQLGFFEKK